MVNRKSDSASIGAASRIAAAIGAVVFLGAALAAAVVGHAWVDACAAAVLGIACLVAVIRGHDPLADDVQQRSFHLDRRQPVQGSVIVLLSLVTVGAIAYGVHPVCRRLPSADVVTAAEQGAQTLWFKAYQYRADGWYQCKTWTAWTFGF